MPSIIESVGIEIEFANVPREEATNVARDIGWNITDDGSTRTRRNTYPGLPIEIAGAPLTVPFGGEFISPIINTSSNGTWKKDIADILSFLSEHGEGIDARSSIHVHVNAGGVPMYVLHNLVHLGLYLEAAVYRLACAEAGVHRGAMHLDYGYCRPISEKGPPVTETDSGKMRQVFTYNTLLRSDSKSSLKKALGRYDRSGGRYHEARYMWLNFLSLFQLGTVEFRAFNSTLNYRNIVAWVDMSQSFLRTAFSNIPELEKNPLGSSNVTLNDLINILDIRDQKTVYTLEDLWSSAEYQRPVKGFQMGHLSHRIAWGSPGAGLLPPIVDQDEVFSFTEFSLGRAITPIVPGGFSI